MKIPKKSLNFKKHFLRQKEKILQREIILLLLLQKTRNVFIIFVFLYFYINRFAKNKCTKKHNNPYSRKYALIFVKFRPQNLCRYNSFKIRNYLG